jgi:hypothetical protein
MNSKFALIVLLSKLCICKTKFKFSYSYSFEPIHVLGRFQPVEIIGHIGKL